MAFYVIKQGRDPQRVYALLGGFEAWEEAGYPLREGTAER